MDARYHGQSFELPVPANDWVERFHRAHEERYGYRQDETQVEAVTLRVVVEAPGLPLQQIPLERANGSPPGEDAQVYANGSQQRATRWWRKDLCAGHTLAGPGLVMEYSSTTWIPSGWTVEVDPWGSLLLHSEA